MRIGIDVDGVLANFNRAYEDIVIATSGRDIFPARWPVLPLPCWDWPEHYGYTKEEVSAAWTVIKASPDFWLNLEILPGAMEFLAAIRAATFKGAHVYFVTNRPGTNTQQQTAQWLHVFYGLRPSVIVSADKGDVSAALKLNFYLDDKLENIVDVLKKSPTTVARLLDFPYNQSTKNKKVGPKNRIDSLAEFATLLA